MHPLARELRDLGYERTERESPFDEDGTLWTNSYELVCDKTATVIRKGGLDNQNRAWNDDDELVHRYKNSNQVKLYGGYTSSYDWGNNDKGNFTYDS